MTDGVLPDIDAALIDEALVAALLREQFPDWAELPLRRVVRGGNDHRMFRLGSALSVRLPSAPGYVPQVGKEQAWLPRLAPAVTLPIPTVRGAGRPSPLFPAPWSVYDWIDGEPAAVAHVDDPVALASALAEFLVSLRGADVQGAPGPGIHSAFRGGPVAHWDAEVRDLLRTRVSGRERERATAIWHDALAAEWAGPPVWVHGDVSVNNLIVRDGRLAAVIDFGCSAAGDPACDTTILWTYFDGAVRETFRREVALDEATWARGRGWALWKALIMITNKPPGQAELARHVLDELLAGV